MSSRKVEFNPYSFDSEVCSLDRVMTGGITNEVGLLIPDYQRSYTWQEMDVERLFTDILSSLSTRAKKPSGHFLGATVWNLRKRADETEFTVQSYDVVDGQQRLTTCVLFTMTLILGLKHSLKDLKSGPPLSHGLSTWLTAEMNQIEKEARTMIVGDLHRSEIPFPRIINEEDVRGSTFRGTDYRSPISKLSLAVAKAMDHETVLDLDAIKVSEGDEDVLGRLKDNFNHFTNYLNSIAEEQFFKDFNIDYIKTHSLKSKHFIDLFTTPPPQSEFDSTIITDERFEKHIRLVQFFWHFLKATCMSVITCEDEDAAFSIFDSLNTTGVPLTAIQTLKPFVMRDYRDKNRKFKNSPAAENFQYLDESIKASGTDANRQSEISKELCIHASLLGANGKVINNNLSLQRSTLREIHQQCAANNEIDLASTVLEKVARYRNQFCFIENIRAYSAQSSLSPIEEDQVKLTSAFLANTGTRLYRPLLTRFYWNPTEVKFFQQACKAIAAFYVLRRATTDTTDRIDDIFRTSMIGTTTFPGLELSYLMPRALTTSDIDGLKNHLKSNLKSSGLDFSLADKNEWVQHVKNMTHFSGAKSLLRFMLFVAHDGAKIDSHDITLIQRNDASPDSSTEFLSFGMWDKDLYETLEHVAPQNEQSHGWSGVYDDPKLKNTIGNFVLLPKGQNSALKDSAWATKKLFLQVLLSDSLTDRQTLVATAKADGTSLPKSIENGVLSTSTTLVKSHMLSGLENVIDWDADYIRKRSERLCSLVWDRMKEWLE